MIARDLQDAWETKSADARVALVIRHAERFPVTNLLQHHEVRLTPEGHVQAQQLGKRLAALSARTLLFHSTVERCAETARGIAEGYAGASVTATVAGVLPTLASPYVHDPEQAFAAADAMGPSFVRAWLDGEIDAAWMKDRTAGAEEQLGAAALALSKDTPLSVLVTHDWNLVLVREEFLALRHEEAGWPGFLDGYVVVDDGGDSLLLICQGKRARVSRARVNAHAAR